MADDSPAPGTNPFHLPKFSFQVSWDSRQMAFAEVSGLSETPHEIEYRRGESGSFSTIKMPGLTKYGNVTMKRGVFKSDDRGLEWLHQCMFNTRARMPVTITLLDEADQPCVRWTLANAFPTKVTGASLTADGSKVMVETIEMMHEGLTHSSV